MVTHLMCSIGITTSATTITTTTSAVGDDNYHAVYNTLSLTACSSTLYGYLKYRGTGPKLFNPKNPVLALGAFVLQSTSFIAISQLAPKLQIPVVFGSSSDSSSSSSSNQMQDVPSSVHESQPKHKNDKSYAVRCPIDFKAADVAEGGGLERITRHPMLWILGFMGAGTALTSVYACEAICFGFFPLFALIGSSHQDYRHRRNSGGLLTPEKDATTSNIPFLALISGKQKWSDVVNEAKIVNAGVGITVGLVLALKRIR